MNEVWIATTKTGVFVAVGKTYDEVVAGVMNSGGELSIYDTYWNEAKERAVLMVRIAFPYNTIIDVNIARYELGADSASVISAAESILKGLSPE